MGSSDDGMKRARAISERVVLVPERVDRVKKTFSFRNLGVLVGLGVFDGVGVLEGVNVCVGVKVRVGVLEGVSVKVGVKVAVLVGVPGIVVALVEDLGKVAVLV